MNDVRLGEFEELVLLSVAGLGDRAYAVAIQQHLEVRASRLAAMGAVYTALDRLEQKGYVTSTLGAVTRQRGGRRKRYYRITDAGSEALVILRDARQRLWQDWKLAT